MTEQQIADTIPQPRDIPRQAGALQRSNAGSGCAEARVVCCVVLAVLGILVVAFFIWRGFFASPGVPPNIVALSGRIEGDDSAVAPKTAGRILEVRQREGDTVKAGDVIAVLDDEQIRPGNPPPGPRCPPPRPTPKRRKRRSPCCSNNCSKTNC